MDGKPFIVAEIGCNHKGDFNLALEMIVVAAQFCKVDAVKFQKRNIRELLNEEEYDTPHPNPIHSFGETYGEHREFLEFDLEKHKILKKKCEDLNLVYSTSVWDLTSAREIASLNPRFIKVPSASNTNFDMLEYLCEKYKGEIHISIGMTKLKEEEEIVDFFIKKGRNKDLVLYSCTSGYPVPDEDVCLLEIKRIKEKYGKDILDIGFSGHHQGISIDVAAFVLGANKIERHFTLDRTWKGTDQAASLEPDGMRRLARDINIVSKSVSFKQKEVLDIEEVQRMKLKWNRKELNKENIYKTKNNNNFVIDWSGKAFNYNHKEIKKIVEVLKEANTFTQGKYLIEFEKDFSNYNNMKNVFAVANCTNALDLIALLSGLNKDDEIIIPAHTFCASAIPFARTGAKIIWADIDSDTRVISVESIRKNLSKRTKAIVVVHLYGLMADMDSIMSIAKEHNCLVIEDCAQALGAEYKGKKAGTFGDFAAFSFHTQKNLTTLGEGGMLIVKSDELAKKVPGLRHNGVRPFDFEREHYWIPAMSNVDLDIDGVMPYNFCINEIQCAVGSAALKRIDSMNNIRIKRANYFKNALEKFSELSFQKVGPEFKHVYHLLSAKYNGKAYGKTNNDFIKIMAYEHKIKVIVQYYPLYRYPLFKKIGFGNAECPNIDNFFDNMVSFPFHIWMSDSHFEYMLESTIETLKKLRGRNN